MTFFLTALLPSKLIEITHSQYSVHSLESPICYDLYHFLSLYSSNMDHEGASNNERLLAASKNDDEDMLLEIFGQPKSFDINFQDGLGNTALHYAVSRASTSVLEHLLSHEECDVDPVNRLEKATPLHFAVSIESAEPREYCVRSLLEAGADDTIRNKNGDTAQDLVNPRDEVTLSVFREFQAEKQIARDDIAYDDDDDLAGGDEDESD